MRFTQRLLIAFVLPALLFVAGLAAAIGSLINTQHEFDHYLNTEAALANNVREMYAQGLQMGQAMRNVVLDPQNPTAYKNLDAAREAYDKAYTNAQRLSAGLPAEAAVRALADLRAAQGSAQQRVLEVLKTNPAQAVEVLNKQETPAWRQLRTALLQLRDELDQLTQQTQAGVKARADRARWLSLGLAVLAIAVAVVLGLMLRRTLRREIGGDPAVARATLRQIAGGDLTGHIPRAQDPQSLMGALDGMQTSMRTLVAQVQQSSASIEVATREISLGNHDLSARTEAAASSLQQTAASMEELTSTVRNSADAARQANQLAASASEVAVRGGEVVSQVVSTMQEIHHSSQKINDIIGTIDGIAFQTNILALNAAVEAARAGEQGRGFAVVAGEVRNLAQRSAEAAKEIKGLIGTSVDKVDVGTKLVADAGQTMSEIVGSIQRVSDIVGEITAAAGEQSDGIGQVNVAVNQLDQMTQQNAALVEESAAAAQSLKDQAARLAQVVAVFRLDAHATSTLPVSQPLNNHAAPVRHNPPKALGTTAHKPAPAPKAAALPRPAAPKAATAAAAPVASPTPAAAPKNIPVPASAEGDWESF